MKSQYEKILISIYSFSLYGEKDGPLSGWRKFMYRLAGKFTVFHSMSWLYWLRAKVAGRVFLAFLLGIDKQN